MTPRRVAVVSGLAAAVAALVVLATGVSGQALRLGAPAPDFAGGPWIGGDPLSIDALRGRVVLVEFWTYG